MKKKKNTVLKKLKKEMSLEKKHTVRYRFKPTCLCMILYKNVEMELTMTCSVSYTDISIELSTLLLPLFCKRLFTEYEATSSPSRRVFFVSL